MIRKKAQGEIITTVLIILLVLAAIVIVWQVVNSTVTRAGGQAQTASNCVGVQMNIEGKITNASNIATFNIKRGGDSVGVDGLRILLTNSTGGVLMNDTITTVPSAYNTISVSSTFSAINKGSNTVSIAPKLGTTICDPIDSQSFVA